MSVRQALGWKTDNLVTSIHAGRDNFGISTLILDLVGELHLCCLLCLLYYCY
jgi:hypothetical protein